MKYKGAFFADDTVDSLDSDAALTFAQAILGNSPPTASSPNADRSLLEWLEQVAPDHAANARRRMRLDAETNEPGTQQNGSAELRAVVEAGWDPSKHPRGAFSQNRGWFSSAGGAGAAVPRPGRIEKPPELSAPRERLPKRKTAVSHKSPIAKFLQTGTSKKSSDQKSPTRGDAGETRGDQTDGESDANQLRESDLRSYFKLIYGARGQKLLDAFEKSGGKLKIENPWFGNSALDGRNTWRPQQIRIRQELGPAEAARELMEQLIEASGMTEVRQHLDHSGFENIEALIASYKESVRQAAGTVAFAAEIYLSGITIANEGADWVITINDLSEGNYYAAIGLLPLVPATVGTKNIVLKHGRNTIRISPKAVRGAKTLPIEELIELLESTRKLSRNMEKAGIARPAGTAAHHIVPAGVKKFSSAVEAREILRKFGIDVANAGNGVYLPSKFDDAVKAAYHGTLHSKRYFDEVLARLEKAESADDALLILNQIRKELLAGKFPH